jgi:ubiquinol-cytochrome c reductase cytochrome b subunit
VERPPIVIVRGLKAVDRRGGSTHPVRFAMRYVFPDHWAFMWGEIALYCFVVLVATGVYLTFWFDPSRHQVVYQGSYVPLRGSEMSQAYRSTVDLSLDNPFGLLMRQTHHWAALVFLAAIVMHLMRIFFTGAFRRPRELNWLIGLVMLMTALLEGFAGYSLPDDLPSGMGLAIAYAVVLSIPVLGGPLGYLFWDGAFPGGNAFESRLYTVHVLAIPALIGALIAVHLAFVVMLRHTQFRGPHRTERNVVGSPMWPGYALRSLSLFLGVAAVLVLLGGLVQINPIWQYGPYEPALATNGAQPDWYLGWLIGALRMMPNWEPNAFGYTVPNPFFGGAGFPALAFGVLFAWPWIERFATGDRAEHHLLDRPYAAPWRTAFGAAFFTWVLVPFVAGSADRVFVGLDIPYEGQILVLRVLWLLLPAVAFGLTLHWMRGVRRREAMRAQQAAS